MTLWIDLEGNGHEIEEMDPDHAHNALLMLESNKESFYWAEAWRLLGFTESPFIGDAARDALDVEMNRMLDMSPEEWFEESLVVAALRERVAAIRQRWA